MVRLLLMLTGLCAISIAVVPCDAGDNLVEAVVESSVFTPEQIEFFEINVRPVLVEHCFECHSSDALELAAGLYVDSREAILKGGESGAAVVVGRPAESLLIQSVNYESNEMPPDRKLDQRHIDALTQWVEMGAPWPQVTSSPGIAVGSSGPDWSTFDWSEARQQHWAWRSVVRPVVPPVVGAVVLNPIDNFIAAKRVEAGLDCVAFAEPTVLARRIYIDLIGVPPTPSQVHQFVEAHSIDRQQAVATLVDQLLQSPMYGQRWSRHWLDVARYSDGQGGMVDPQPLEQAWRYRDWVVEALNRDMPIDEFIRLQVAGDLTGKISDAIATGFFALGPTYQSDGGDPQSVAQSQGETLDDRIDTLTRGLLGITASCARCHDHKFDPIPQQDYYSLAGIFNNTTVGDRPLVAAEIVKAFESHQQAIDALNKQVKQFEAELKNANREANDEEQGRLDQWQVQLAELTANAPQKYEIAHTLHDSGSADMKVALRGNLLKTGDLAPRRFLRLFAGSNPTHFTKGSGRAELASAIVDPQNPLTARVFVNRVWMHHFGAGLVRTPSNFGTLGESPTHPLLLDWLTDEFVSGGWSLKALHRQILTSATYQLASTFDRQSFGIDGDNRLLWRMSPRRMDVEAWRDSLLSVTGELDLALSGPAQPDITTSKRRTLYAKVSRNGDVFASDLFLRRFDFPLMRATVAMRPSSIVPQQFLFLLNSNFMIERAQTLVRRLQMASESDEQRIEQAYELLFLRSPSLTELQIGLDFVSEETSEDGLSSWDKYAQVLLSSNEFMYVR